MGRHKIYPTETERHSAEKKRKLKWYYKNSERVRKANMDYYWTHRKYEKTNNK